MKTFRFLIAFLCLSLSLRAQTVVDIVVNSPDHNTLETAVLAAGLETTLSGTGPFTLFAPTDAAFAAIDPADLQALLDDPSGALTDVLTYHAVPGNATSGDLSDGQILTTVNGKDVTITIDNGDVFVNDVLVTMADIPASNGTVHVINAVLLPPVVTVLDVVVNSPDHTILETAVIEAGLAATLSGDGPFTVFAPTDAAFDALPAGLLDDLLAAPSDFLTNILLYHVLPGENLSTGLADGQMVATLNNGATVTVTIDGADIFINDALVTMADIPADNGVVHVLNAVLVPNTVNDIVTSSADHNTLQFAVETAGLEGTLSGAGPFTLFAPTDAAFDALPPGLLANLVSDPFGALTDILLYHTLEGEVLSTDLSNAQVATTINGVDVIVTIDGPDVFINNALVTMADIPADNGVVHVIDAVLVPNTITDLVVYSPIHTTLETAVVEAGLAATLSGDGPFTVFAPTDDAFDALPAGALDDLLADPTGALADVLLYHAVEGAAFSTDLSDGQIVPTINGKDVTVTIDMDGNVFINDAQVIVADITTANGVVHVIDAVLLPPSNTVVDIIVNSPDHNTLETAVIEAGLAGTLSAEGPFTVFAPTDDAFDALPAGLLDDLLADPTGALADILLYHALEGEVLSTDLSNAQVATTINGVDVIVTIDGPDVFINNALVTMADIPADNGVVHVIDAVLVPNTITDLVVYSPIHTTLETAVVAAGLAGTLSGDGPFTVFAPTDDAFDALPAGALDDLLIDPTGALADVLLYHAVEGAAFSTDLSDGQIIPTINGKDVTVTIDMDGNVFINDAQVIVADINTTNGVVHVINAVLLPPSNTVVDIIVNSPDHNTLETAVIEAGLAGTLSGEGPFTVFAPTDAAFDALPAGALDDLLADPTGALTDVLTYHVADGAVLSTDLSNGQNVEMLNMESVTITIDGSNVFVNDAQVTMADFDADNGVVHVINGVLLPPTAVNELSTEFADVKVFPNPATDFVTIDLNRADANIEQVILANANGQIIDMRKENTNRLNYNLKAVPSGTYYLILTIDGTRFSQSVQVQH